MKLFLERDIFTDTATTGRLSIGMDFECYTLEDVVRDIKIKGETAIPYGTYEVIINWSNRFQRPMPLLLNVPGFEGIRIHAGNTAADTEGCILVGQSRGVDYVKDSRKAFAELFVKLVKAMESDKIFIEVTHS
jgi:hypothetical protein